jgi:hypothetical protein
MPKGNVAKDVVTKKIIEAFGNDYIGEFDKKLYVWADDGGERVQISISLTCPKILRGIEETEDYGDLNFEDAPKEKTQPSNWKPADVTQEEKDTLAELMAKFGL